MLGATRLAGNIIETNKVTHTHTCFYFHTFIQIGTGERSCYKDFIKFVVHITYVNSKRRKLTTAYGFLHWVQAVGRPKCPGLDNISVHVGIHKAVSVLLSTVV